MPVLPIDLFGALPDFVHGRLIERAVDGGGAGKLVEDGRTPIAGVSLASRMVASGAIARPALDPGSAADIRAVLASCAEFEAATCGLGKFLTLMFRHNQFTGRGDFLLRWLRVPITREGFDRLITRLYPDAAGRGARSRVAARLARTVRRPNGSRARRSSVCWSAQLAERTQVSTRRIGQILSRALRDLLRWYAQAETAERLLAGPDDRTLAEAADRRAAALAAADAERARHLEAVFANADVLWEDATRRMISRSSHDHDAAQILLDDLLAAADRHAGRAAFERRLAELRADTSKFRRFWQRWDARHIPGSESAPPT